MGEREREKISNNYKFLPSYIIKVLVKKIYIYINTYY